MFFFSACSASAVDPYQQSVTVSLWTERKWAVCPQWPTRLSFRRRANTEPRPWTDSYSSFSSDSTKIKTVNGPNLCGDISTSSGSVWRFKMFLIHPLHTVLSLVYFYTALFLIFSLIYIWVGWVQCLAQGHQRIARAGDWTCDPLTGGWQPYPLD